MPSSADLICIAPHKVNDFWPYAEPLLKAACDRCGEWSVAEIRREIDKGGLLWIVWDGAKMSAACATRLVEIKGEKICQVLACGGEGEKICQVLACGGEGEKICQVLACGGEGEDWRTRFEEIEDYARNEGCVKAQIQGREGWRKIFCDYDLAWVALEKRLDS